MTLAPAVPLKKGLSPVGSMVPLKPAVGCGESRATWPVRNHFSSLSYIFLAIIQAGALRRITCLKGISLHGHSA